MENPTIQFVADKILSMLGKGAIPWEMPWTTVGEGCWSRATGKNYSMLNTLLIAMQYMERNESNAALHDVLAEIKGEYLTFNQIKEHGGSVNKGAKSYKVIFFQWMEKNTDEIDENGDAVIKRYPILKMYNVFNLRDCSGIEQKHFNKEDTIKFTANATAEEIVADYLAREKVTLKHERQNRAFYRATTDTIVLPEREQFNRAGDYYSTLFHEMTHSTGHPSRLNRITDTAAFGSEDYSVEELTAEIGSASLLATTGLQDEKTFEQNAAYCQNWLQALQNDKRMIIVATARAEKAIQMILGG